MVLYMMVTGKQASDVDLVHTASQLEEAVTRNNTLEAGKITSGMQVVSAKKETTLKIQPLSGGGICQSRYISRTTIISTVYFHPLKELFLTTAVNAFRNLSNVVRPWMHLPPEHEQTGQLRSS